MGAPEHDSILTMSTQTYRCVWKPAPTVVKCRSSDGVILAARPVRLTRFSLTFELDTPGPILRVSEVLTDLQLIIHDRRVYSGQGVIRNLLEAGTNVICEVTLDETGWCNVELARDKTLQNGLRDAFKEFVGEWQKLYKVSPKYKEVIADMHTFLTDLRLWIEQIELAISPPRSIPSGKFEQQLNCELAAQVLPPINALFDKFETVAARVEPDLAPVHYVYMRRQLHPIVLCAPFPHRAFHKPLGYAGDYETVNMMMRDRFEGSSLFAKLLNAWFLSQPPSEGHRNRLAYFYDKLVAETARAVRTGHKAHIFSLGCGLAWEVQQFMAKEPLSDRAHFTLADFDAETVGFVRNALTTVKRQFKRVTQFEVLQVSAQQLLLHKALKSAQSAKPQFDFVYCGGLFDYLRDGVCKELLQLLYDWTAPDGLVVVTNLHPSNPLRYGMSHLLDWHLIYRTGQQLLALAPSDIAPVNRHVRTDRTGTNLFMELRKPPNAWTG